MSANYYELQKFAETGQASPSMTYYDRMRASTLMGGAVQTLTGITPLSFKSNGKPLISWSMKGNGQHTGTPSPQSIIMPTFCGVRTGNLFDDDNAEFGKWVNSNGSIQTNATYAAGYDIKVETTSEFAIKYYGDKPYSYSMAFYDSNGDFLSRVHISNPSDSYDTFPVPENAVSARFQVAVNTSVVMTSVFLKAMKLMLNLGSEPLPYEPYGYKIPITCAGQTVPVYLGQTQTVRKIKKVVFDGTEGWIENTSGENTFRARLVLSQANINSTAGYCSHLPFVATGISQDRPLAGCYNSATFLRFDRNMANDITEFKSYLAQQYAAGTPVTVWYVLAEPQTGIVNEPLAKIGDYCDELSSTDAGVAIPTVKGSNTLTVDTTIQPSEMTIKYRE